MCSKQKEEKCFPLTIQHAMISIYLIAPIQVLFKDLYSSCNEDSIVPFLPTKELDPDLYIHLQEIVPDH